MFLGGFFQLVKRTPHHYDILKPFIAFTKTGKRLPVCVYYTMKNEIIPNKTLFDILGEIEKGTLLIQIAEKAGISKQALNGRLSRYKKKGLIIQKKGVYYLTSNGVYWIRRRVPDDVYSTFTRADSVAEHIRSHNVRIKLSLRVPVENPQVYLGQKGVEFQNMGLRNVNAGSFNIENYVIQLMPKSMVVILPDVETSLSTSLSEMVALTWVGLRGILDQLESKFGLKVVRPAKDFYFAQIISQHIAFTNNPLIDSVKGVVPGVWVIEYDEEDGKPRLIADFSDAPELEAVHSKHVGEDAEAVKKNLQPVIQEMKNGEFEERRKSLECRTCGLEFKQAVSEFKTDLKKQREAKRAEQKHRTERGIRLAEYAYLKKHRGEDSEANLKKEFHEAIKNYIPLLK